MRYWNNYFAVTLLLVRYLYFVADYSFINRIYSILFLLFFVNSIYFF